MKTLRLWTIIGSLSLLFSLDARAYAARPSAGTLHTSSPAVYTQAHPSLRTGLFVSPMFVSVGQRVVLSVAAPVPSLVVISFRSFHHAFSGTAFYQRSSRSYVESVYLIPRVHGTEQAQVVVSVTPRATRRTYHLYGQFLIRGNSMGMGMGMNGIPQNNGGDSDGDNNGGPMDGDGDR